MGELIITDVTRMGGTRVCVAGYSDKTKRNIRPVFAKDNIDESWLYWNGEAIIRPFAKIDLKPIAERSDPPHTEDCIIDPDLKLYKGLIPENEREKFLKSILDSNVESIFGAEIQQDHGYYIHSNGGLRSLGTIQAKVVNLSHKEYDRWDYRLIFRDLSKQEYSLQVTDLSFQYYVDHLREQKEHNPQFISQELKNQLKEAKVYLRIGLARGWDKYPDRCYLQVTGLYTIPDYLDGRCFADFKKQN